MTESTLQDIINELSDAEMKLGATILKLFGKIEATDFSDEYHKLQDALKKLIEFSQIKPEEESSGDQVPE